MKYSPSTEGFYPDVNNEIQMVDGVPTEVDMNPPDCIQLTDAEYAAIIADIEAGKRIIHDGVNKPGAGVDFTPYWSATDLEFVKASRKQEAVDMFTAMSEIVTKPKAYENLEKDTWPKQEKVAEKWVADWNNGTPVLTIAADQALPANERTYQILVNLVAGELNIAKSAVTDQNVYDKASSIIANSVTISDYFAAILGTLHKVINDLDAVDLLAGDAKDQLIAVDITIIEAVAAAELGL